MGMILIGAGLAGACQGNVFALKVGDCFNNSTTEGNVSNVEVIPCTDPHDYEVYFLATYAPDGSTYPGETLMTDFSDTACANSFQGYVGKSPAESTLTYYFLSPTSESWDSGDRTIDCVVTLPSSEKLTGSVKGTNQ
ncbi:MAG: septum formation family protein [Candidatus Limnocylindrales bacterium]